METRRDQIEAYLDALRPYLASVRVQEGRVGRANTDRFPLEVALQARGGAERRFRPEVRTSHLTEATVAGLIASARRTRKPCLLLAPLVSGKSARALQDAGIAYIDRAGNCHVELPGGTVVHVEGRRSRVTNTRRTMRPESLRVMFVLLARPGQLTQPVRATAELAQVGKSTVANVLADLEESGFIGKTRTDRRLLDGKRLLNVWATGYETLLRPRLLIGRYHLTSGATEEQIAVAARKAGAWGWGGTSGAYKLTRYYRGPGFSLHLDGPHQQFLRDVRAAPSPTGELVVIKGVGPLTYQAPEPDVVHPLLIYAELLASTDPRAHDTANEFREQFIDPGLPA